MKVTLFYADELARYRFSAHHPFQPERFTLAVSLMEAWGLLTGTETDVGDSRRARVVVPVEATDADLLTAHSAEYVNLVHAASLDPENVTGRGIGEGDTPAFLGMHEAAALAVGASMLAADAVASRATDRAFSPAGGLHHARHDRASGFCIYNDAVVAIERLVAHGLRVAYVDIDAHHGDGVEAAFWERADVLTLSVHESGRFLFPGTGHSSDIGNGEGRGFSVNVPLPPFADSTCYQAVFDDVIAPCVSRYAPDVLVLQAGADTHHADPLTHLGQSVAGYADLVSRIIRMAENICRGRMLVLGGGGYRPYDEVPRMWACLMSQLLGHEIPTQLPDEWIAQAMKAGGGHELMREKSTFSETSAGPTEEQRAAALKTTRTVIDRVRTASPLLQAGA